MSCIDAIERLYQPSNQCADALVAPLRFCHRQWENFTTFDDTHPCGMWRVIVLIVAIAPLALLTLVSYLLSGVGIAFKACTEEVGPEEVGPEMGAAAFPPKPYDDASWETLNARIAVTPQDVQHFVDYTYDPEHLLFAPHCSTNHERQLGIGNHRNEIQVTTPFRALARDFKFFYGNCDEDLPQGRRELGWGCAWRSIQMALASAMPIPYGYTSLYRAHRRDQGHDSEWAEPGYGKQICDGLDIGSELCLFNRQQGTAKTPTALCTPIASFADLTNKLIAHFLGGGGPVMIDDGVLACSIGGIKVIRKELTHEGTHLTKEYVVLWIADPHKTSREAGLFELVLDGTTGRKLHCTGIDNGQNGMRTAQNIHPHKTGAQGWMLLFPEGRRPQVHAGAQAVH